MRSANGGEQEHQRARSQQEQEQQQQQQQPRLENRSRVFGEGEVKQACLNGLSARSVMKVNQVNNRYGVRGYVLSCTG